MSVSGLICTPIGRTTAKSALTNCSLESRYLSQAVIPSIVDTRFVTRLDGIVFCRGIPLAFCACGRRGRGFRAWGGFGDGARRGCSLIHRELAVPGCQVEYCEGRRSREYPLARPT